MNMTEEKLKARLEGLQNKNFDEVFAFLKSSFCFQYDKKKNPHSNLFWRSPLSTKYTSFLLNSALVDEILLGYFSSPNHVNTLFIELAANEKLSCLIKTIKLSKAFLEETHWISFAFFKNYKSPDKLKILHKELEFIRLVQQEWNAKAIFYQGIVTGYDYEDILMHTISYFEKFKRSSIKLIGNKDLLQSREVSLCYVLNTLLNFKKQDILKNQKSITLKYNTTTEFKNAVDAVMPSLNPAEGVAQRKWLGTDSPSQEKKLLRETIEFFFAKAEFEETINTYCAGMCEFDYWDKSTLYGELLTNKFWEIHKRNDLKCIFQEILCLNKAHQEDEVKKFNTLNNKDLFEKETFAKVYCSLIYWEYLKLPFRVKTTRFGEIDMEKVFCLLIAFSNHLMPNGRLIHVVNDSIGVAKFKKPKEFQQLFGCDYIICIEENRLVNNIVYYFGWAEDEVKNIVAYLTTDLTENRAFEIDFLSRPFLKIGNQYIWLSSLLRDRRWDTILHRRLVKDKLNNHVQQSQNLEEEIAKVFNGAGFLAIPSYKYKNIEEDGEIDAVAYKDKMLFIVELKTTYIEENRLRYAQYESSKFEYKAAEQLTNAQAYIVNNWKELQIKLNIDYPLEELKIVPLIVSNIFEQDDLIYKGQFLKISLFELFVILQNDLKSMVIFKSVPISVLMDFENPVDTSEEALTLWTNPTECSAQDVFDAIKKNKVWHFLNRKKEFSKTSKFEIRNFDSDYKFLE